MSSGKCEQCNDGKEYVNLAAHMRKHAEPKNLDGASKTYQGPDESHEEAKASEKAADPMMTVIELLKANQQVVTDLAKRVERIETGGKFDFKANPDQEDVERAGQVRDEFSVDQRVRRHRGRDARNRLRRPIGAERRTIPDTGWT